MGPHPHRLPALASLGPLVTDDSLLVIDDSLLVTDDSLLTQPLVGAIPAPASASFLNAHGTLAFARCGPCARSGEISLRPLVAVISPLSPAFATLPPQQHIARLSAQAPQVARRTWHIARRTWHVARGTSHVARRTWHVARRTWHVARGTWHVARGTLHVHPIHNTNAAVAIRLMTDAGSSHFQPNSISWS
jgi:hypothetical protein